MSSFAVRCYQDGSFTINGASGDAMMLPACNPIGCDRSKLPFTGMTDKCRYGNHEVRTAQSKRFRDAFSNFNVLFEGIFSLLPNMLSS